MQTNEPYFFLHKNEYFFSILNHFSCYCGLFSELLIPERANVFYALNNSVDLNFVVRHRTEQANIKEKKKGRRKVKKLSL